MGEICYRFNHPNEDLFPLLYKLLRSTGVRRHNELQLSGSELRYGLAPSGPCGLLFTTLRRNSVSSFNFARRAQRLFHRGVCVLERPDLRGRGVPL